MKDIKVCSPQYLLLTLHTPPHKLPSRTVQSVLERPDQLRSCIVQGVQKKYLAYFKYQLEENDNRVSPPDPSCYFVLVKLFTCS